MTIKLFITAMAALVPVAVAAQNSAPIHDADGVTTTEVIVHRSDFQDADAAASLDKRIAAASAAVCPERDVRNVKMQLKARKCRREAKAGADQQLAQIQEARRGQ
jgi:UrcA family protein